MIAATFRCEVSNYGARIIEREETYDVEENIGGTESGKWDIEGQFSRDPDGYAKAIELLLGLSAKAADFVKDHGLHGGDLVPPAA